MRFFRKSDYKRAQCEDPDIIHGWFALAWNTIVKYGIHESDIYNFDETGFMTGVIATSMAFTSSDRLLTRNWSSLAIENGLKSSRAPLTRLDDPSVCLCFGQISPLNLHRNWVIAMSENGWTTNERGLEWIQDFNKHSKHRTICGYRLLLLDGHESHNSTDFELYCKENNIITLCMLPHLSNLLQSLDTGCFGSLKLAYG